jgi:HK97 family phage portal protein
VRLPFGLEIRRAEKALTPASGSLWHRLVHEPFAGAWQRNQEEKRGDVLTYPTLYACIASIAQDIGILRFRMRKLQNGVWVPGSDPAVERVLDQPNHYQNQQQFRESWQISRLTQGNTYALKRRDAQRRVDALYVLDPFKVRPMVADDGSVWYELLSDRLTDLPSGNPGENLLVPASEISHDRELTLHHPLIGVPPLCAAHWPAVKNLRILRSAAEFFGNKAQAGGILVAPGAISEPTAARLKAYWDENFTGANAGKIAVIGDGLKYEPLTTNAVDSQLVEQMRYSDEQICQAFRIPPFIVGIGQIPAGMKADDMALAYHNRALHPRIDAMENLLDSGLDVKRPLGIELDLEPLLRMDYTKRAEYATKLVGGKVMLPDEARAIFDMLPTAGGATLWGQHQDYPLGALADRTDLGPAPAQPVDETDKALALLWRKSPETIAHV